MAKDPYRFFRIEAKELIEKLNTGLLELEKKPNDQALLDQLFRHAHTLKGSSRLVKLDNIGEVSHSMEDLFGAAKNDTLKITSYHIDLFLQVADIIDSIIKLIDSGMDPHIPVVDMVTLLKEANLQATSPITKPPITDDAIGKPTATKPIETSAITNGQLDSAALPDLNKTNITDAKVDNLSGNGNTMNVQQNPVDNAASGSSAASLTSVKTEIVSTLVTPTITIGLWTSVSRADIC